MTFTLTIEATNTMPDFSVLRLEESPEHAAERIAVLQKAWLLDWRADLGDVLRLASNKIQRGEKAGDILTLDGDKCGGFSFIG
jgi:hypothetical protein